MITHVSAAQVEFILQFDQIDVALIVIRLDTKLNRIVSDILVEKGESCVGIKKNAVDLTETGNEGS